MRGQVHEVPAGERLPLPLPLLGLHPPVRVAHRRLQAVPHLRPSGAPSGRAMLTDPGSSTFSTSTVTGHGNDDNASSEATTDTR